PHALNASCLFSSLSNGLGTPAEHIPALLGSPLGTEPHGQGGAWVYARESSAHAQRIAKAKWEFFYGSLDPPGTGNAPPRRLPPSLGLRGKPGACETGIIRRTVKYSETDLDSVPLRCYRETNIDDILAEKDEGDSAIESQKDSESNPSVTGALGRRPSEPEEPFPVHGGECPRNRLRGEEADEDDEVFEATRQEKGGRVLDGDERGLLKSPVPFLLGHSLSRDGMDSFSKHFESIMESHRAKGTSYTSLDSIDVLSSPARTPGTYFTFDLPALTPEIQDQIRDSAKLIEQNFAPLAHLEPDSGTMDRETGPATQPCSPRQGAAGLCICGRNWLPNSNTGAQGLGGGNGPLGESDHPLSQLISDSDSELDSTEQLALGSTDTLSNGHKADLEAAKRLAKRLYNLDGFKKADVARHLGKNNEFSKMVAGEYLKFFVFTGMSLDQALRSFLKELALMGETQERERVLAHFSQRYHQCNPGTISSEAPPLHHSPALPVTLIHTGLISNNIGKRMSCSDFIGNLEGLNGGSDFPKELLKPVLLSTSGAPQEWAALCDQLRKSLSELADPNPKAIKRISSGSNPFLDFSQDSSIATYKHGLLVRKSHAEPDCKKS
uniref:Pleckstrin and Sec7 domain containing n=1 Tax=Pelodiscus sinensis TaxID=13735 RepID=K7FL58_PELSI